VDREAAAQLLRRELESYARQSRAELVALMGQTDAYAVHAGDTEYQVEVSVYWDDAEGGPLRVLGAIDDGTFGGAFRPVTDDLIVE
jgi:hypothetical protein